jgi:hypothetical protein
MLTERRAGWIGLDVALVLVACFMFRMRRKPFWIVVLPLALLYCSYLGVFWNAQGTLAQPARAVRSISDPNSRDQASNEYRFAEAYDLRLNIRANPLTGLGFGRPYVFYVPLPDLSFWVFWHYIPHNQVFWVWMRVGPIGFAMFLSVLGIAIVHGVQMLKIASRTRASPYLVAVVGALLMIPSFAFVDIAFTNIRICMLLGLALGTVGVWHRLEAQADEVVR